MRRLELYCEDLAPIDLMPRPKRRRRQGSLFDGQDAADEAG